MITLISTIKKFGNKGEKTGWTYIEISAEQASALNPNVRVSYRVKGKINERDFDGMALTPMGKGDFILSINGDWRKKLSVKEGDQIKVEMEVDNREVSLSADLFACLEHEPEARAYFESMPLSHRKYYSNWIEQAKTGDTKTKRILQTIHACSLKMTYAEMIRSQKKDAFIS
ncbi:MAG: DUF1905 domain-containing protein [Bacteroidetes bacterium]|nr:DUF1905 domain-containing protein [Bacteroidota bacterium]